MSIPTIKTIPKTSVFQQQWWLDITAPGQWHRIEFETKHGRIFFTYARRRRYGVFDEIYRPPLTPFLGFSADHGPLLLSPREYFQLMDDLIAQVCQRIGRKARWKVNLDPDFDWWSPFMWAGCQQMTRYTYRLNLTHGHDDLWNGLNSNARRNIRKSSKLLTVDRQGRSDSLFELFQKTMLHQGKQPGYPKPLLRQLVQAAENQGQGRVYIAYDNDGIPHSGIFLVWDEQTAYYLVGGTDPEHRRSGAMMLTMWEAICDAIDWAPVFDFEGSMQPGIDRFLRNFNPVAMPYYQIYRSPRFKWRK